VKHAFDTTTLTILINALIFSKLYYCCNVWCNTSEHNLSRIHNHNHSARIQMVSRESERKFAPDGSLWFENMATRFLPLQKFAFQELNGNACQQKHAKQNLKNTAVIKIILQRRSEDRRRQSVEK
ncbi:hypothetical protein ACROYT_G031798, partial [Oculina patagonica]